MEASDRLKMLFSGEDEVLLRTEAVNLRPAPQVNLPNPTFQQDSLPSGPPQSSYRPLAEGDPELDDPYIADLVQSHGSRENARKRGGKNNRYGRRSRPGWEAAPPAAPNTRNTSEKKSPHANRGQSGIRWFCQLSLLSRFPYKYIRGSDKDLVAKRFFDQNKFWDRTWDLYYIHPPSDISLQPLILVPGSQAQALLKEINDAFRSNHRFPSRPDQGFLLPFENDGTPQPQHLGRSTNRSMKEDLERSVPLPGADFVPPPGCPDALNRSFKAFKAKIEAAVEATRRKGKAAKGKRHRDQSLRLQYWCRSLKRVHCYLGLRPRLARGNAKQLHIPDGASWETEKKLREDESLSRKANLLPLDVDQPAPFPFVDEPIFICIDVESNERCHTQITEIGISTLDTLDLVGVSPGPEGQNWIKKIRSRHFRISEYGHVVNHDFVNGCPDRFEFGESQWISIKQAANIVDSCFYPPYSALTEFDGRKTYDDVKGPESDYDNDGGVKISFGGEPQAYENSPIEQVKDYKKRPRNLILLGHDISSDMSYMTMLGCKVLSNGNPKNQSPFENKPTFLESLDTSVLFRVLKRQTQATGLSKVLVDLGITGWNLHNAGNDARYTMEAMITIALRARMQDHKADEDKASSINDWPIAPAMEKLGLGDSKSGKKDGGNVEVRSRQRAWEAEIDRRVKTKVEEAEARVREECAMWEAALGGRADWDTPLDDLDGGVATGLVYGRD